jgi:CheY-like chemotaxis protein/two-component sensor histidine kinase
MYNTSLFQKVWRDCLPILKAQAAVAPNRKYGGLDYHFLEENSSQLLSDVDMAANRVAKIVSDLKNFARQSNAADKKPIQINAAIDNAVRLAQTTLRKSGVELTVDLAEDLPMVEGNLQNVEQIVLNLIVNGVQAIAHDRGKIHLKSQFQRRHRQIIISISDNGCGVAPAISGTLFDPFVTNKQAEGGTGLGLSVTYSLVKAHEGEITYQSREGEGSTFIVSFPVSSEKQSARILVVDDDRSVRNVLTESLAEVGSYRVEEASNGIEACIKLGTYRPDLLILDMFMPEMDGLEVCRTINAQPELSEMKVMITTGFPDHPKLKEIRDLGFTEIHYKPLALPDFLAGVSGLLQGK